jgi:hypothetical protein
MLRTTKSHRMCAARMRSVSLHSMFAASRFRALLERPSLVVVEPLRNASHSSAMIMLPTRNNRKFSGAMPKAPPPPPPPPEWYPGETLGRARPNTFRGSYGGDERLYTEADLVFDPGHPDAVPPRFPVLGVTTECPYDFPETWASWKLPSHRTRALELMHGSDFPQNHRIRFFEEIHKYSVDGREFPGSCTGFIDQFFEHTDFRAIAERVAEKRDSRYRDADGRYWTGAEIKEAWGRNGANSAKSGTWMHLMIEQFMNGEPFHWHDPKTGLPLREMVMFFRFWRKEVEPRGWIPYRSEWEIFDIDAMLAGSVDGVLRDPTDGSLVLVDWKRTKDILKTSRDKRGLYPVSHLPPSKYGKYQIQLNIYRHIIERAYGARVSAMFLAVFHPSQPDYLLLPVPRDDTMTLELFRIREEAVRSGSAKWGVAEEVLEEQEREAATGLE